MSKKLNCEQVIALANFYNENLLNITLKKSIEEHLQKCKKCREFYLKSDYQNKNSFVSINPNFKQQKYDIFYKNLSAYMDNELNEKDSMQIKKTVISNPVAREKFQQMYNTKLLLHNSFEHSKNKCKQDYTNSIMRKINFVHSENKFNVYQILGIFSAALTMVVLVLITVLYP